MKKFFDKNLIQQVFNTNEFKGWLISRRWFGDKSMLSNLAFHVNLDYFEIISSRIFLTIIAIQAQTYKKSYFLPMIYYDKIQEILEPREKTRENIVKITENTYSKMIALTVHDNVDEEILSLNLVEAEHCVFFWKNLLFDKNISESYPSMSLDLTLYTEQFEDEVNMRKVQTLIEASLYPDRYEYSLEQLGGGNTTNLIFLIKVYNKKFPDNPPMTCVLKSYKDYSGSLEPRTLYVLVKNNFPNAPKIYGTIKIQEIESIGILEDVPNIGNIGDVYWNELNKMMHDVFKDNTEKHIDVTNKEEISKFINRYCQESLIVSEKIGNYIKNLHQSLIYDEYDDYKKETVNTRQFLDQYTKKLYSLMNNIQAKIDKKAEGAFYTSPKISSILIDIKDIIDKFKVEFAVESIQIQAVHQDLHMQQILYNKLDNQYKFYFIDFEGDPQLSAKEKKRKYPIEKDLGSFLRSLSYIKFNTFLKFIEENFVNSNKYQVPEEFLYSLFFRKASKITEKQNTLESALKLLTTWEKQLMSKIFDKNLKVHFTLINYFTIERALYELDYEFLFRPSKIIVPILGLKEIIEKY